MSVEERLRAIVRDHTGNSYLGVERDDLLATGLGMDSYDLASLLGKVEEAFDVDIPNRAIMEMVTVGDVVDYLKLHAQG